MFDPFTLALLGGAAGGLLNKKDPLKGALLGAGLGAAGGAFAPGLLGGAGAAGSGAGGLTATAGAGTSLAAPAGGSLGGGAGLKAGVDMLAGASSGAGGLSAPTAGFFGSGGAAAQPGALAQLQAIGSGLKPFGEAANAAMAAKGLFSAPDQPIQASPISPTPGTGPQGLTQLVGQNQQAADSQMSIDEQKRQMRRKMVRGLI